MFSEYVVLPSHCGHLIEWCMLYASTPKVLLCEGSTVSCRCPFRGLMLLRGMFLLLFIIYIYISHIYINMWVVQKLWCPKIALTLPLSRSFARQQNRDTGFFSGFRFLYRFINSCIQTFREPYAALSPLQQNIHIHICRCHSDTRSLAWVLGRLPYIYISIYLSCLEQVLRHTHQERGVY